MREFDGRLFIARREDDASLLVPWEIVNQIDRGSLIRSSLGDLHVNIVGVIEYKQPLACAFLA
jgi:hypothetical protein